MEHFKIHQRILRLKDRLDTCYYELGGLLREVFHQQHYLELGFDHFEDYLRETLEFSIRKAFYLMSIWEKVRELSPPRSFRPSLGRMRPITKRQNLLRYISIRPRGRSLSGPWS
jgi:hypothetical protein